MPVWLQVACLTASVAMGPGAATAVVAGETPEEVEIRADEAGGSFGIVVRPRVSGTYRVEVRYGPEISEWLGPTERNPTMRQLGQAIHEHFGARFRLEVIDLRSGEAVKPSKGDGWAWSTTSSDGIRCASDVKTYSLRRGRAYRATLFVEEPSADLAPDSLPRLASSITAETSNNAVFNPFRFIPPLAGRRLGP